MTNWSVSRNWKAIVKCKINREESMKCLSSFIVHKFWFQNFFYKQQILLGKSDLVITQLNLINQIYLGSITISITYPGMFEGFVYVNSLLRINTKHLTQQILGMITKGPSIYYVSTFLTPPPKGAFFSESEIHFSNLPISQKQIFQKTILSLQFEIPAHISKQLIQISSSGQFFGIFFF